MPFGVYWNVTGGDVFLSRITGIERRTSYRNLEDVAINLVKFLKRHNKDRLRVETFDVMITKLHWKDWIDPEKSVPECELVIIKDEVGNRLAIARDKFGNWHYRPCLVSERDLAEKVRAWFVVAPLTIESERLKHVWAAESYTSWSRLAGDNREHIRWYVSGFSQVEVKEWLEAGFSRDEALKARAERANLFSNLEWDKEGIPTEEIPEWVGFGFVSPAAVSAWYRAGHSPETAQKCVSLGLSPSASDDEIVHASIFDKSKTRDKQHEV